MDIGLQIKKFREQQKISQEELALKIFVSRQTILLMCDKEVIEV